jgi:hypothetical protein
MNDIIEIDEDQYPFPYFKTDIKVNKIKGLSIFGQQAPSCQRRSSKCSVMPLKMSKTIGVVEFAEDDLIRVLPSFRIRSYISYYLILLYFKDVRSHFIGS